jgi:hypothetical protein
VARKKIAKDWNPYRQRVYVRTLAFRPRPRADPGGDGQVRVADEERTSGNPGFHELR